MILSASKRTDIPAFYSEWFMNRIAAGEAMYRNPKYPDTVYRVPLSPDLVDGIVFWSKDPRPLIPYLPDLTARGYKFYFEFTLTPYGPEIEPRTIDKEKLIRAFIYLSEQYGRCAVDWRYDPIFIDKRHDVSWHNQMFEKYCSILAPYTEKCTFSFLDGIGRAAEGKSFLPRTPNMNEREELVRTFSKTVKRNGIYIASCAEHLTDSMAAAGAVPNACIDASKIEKLAGFSLKAQKSGARSGSGCGCVENIDVGEYNTCRMGCAYCYACTRPIEKGAGHFPESPLLTGRVTSDMKIIDRKVRSLKHPVQNAPHCGQSSLFDMINER